jgi:hypothetical protein
VAELEDEEESPDTNKGPLSLVAGEDQALSTNSMTGTQ